MLYLKFSDWSSPQLLTVKSSLVYPESCDKSNNEQPTIHNTMIS